MDFFENICLFSPDEEDIIKGLDNIHTSSEQIKKAIFLIKKDLENPNCKKRDESEIKLKQLEKTASLYQKYQLLLLEKKENETSQSYENLKNLFNVVSLNIQKLELLNKEIKRFIKNVENKVNLILVQEPIKEDKKEESNDIQASQLFKKYFGKKEVKNRGDINSIDFMKKLYNAIDRGEITQTQKQNILQYGYYLAFKSEIQSKEGKEGIKNIRYNEKQWRKIFYNELKDIIKSKETAESFFLLSWIEGNGKDQSKNSFGAVGYFQILLSTAQNIDSKITEKDLHNPIKSAIIAAKYIKKLIIEEKKKNPKLEENLIIQKAITKYNGNFSSRLLESKRKDIDKTIYDLFKDLNWIKTQINNYESINEMKGKLKDTHNKYFIHNGDGNGHFSGKSHFGILEKNINSKKQIANWVERYLKQILKQQNMYPIQFNAINKLYNEKS